MSNEQRGFSAWLKRTAQKYSNLSSQAKGLAAAATLGEVHILTSTEQTAIENTLGIAASYGDIGMRYFILGIMEVFAATIFISGFYYFFALLVDTYIHPNKYKINEIAPDTWSSWARKFSDSIIVQSITQFAWSKWQRRKQIVNLWFWTYILFMLSYIFTTLIFLVYVDAAAAVKDGMLAEGIYVEGMPEVNAITWDYVNRLGNDLSDFMTKSGNQIKFTAPIKMVAAVYSTSYINALVVVWNFVLLYSWLAGKRVINPVKRFGYIISKIHNESYTAEEMIENEKNRQKEEATIKKLRHLESKQKAEESEKGGDSDKESDKSGKAEKTEKKPKGDGGGDTGETDGKPSETKKDNASGNDSGKDANQEDDKDNKEKEDWHKILESIDDPKK